MKSVGEVWGGVGVDMGGIIVGYGEIRRGGVLRGEELGELREGGIGGLEGLRKKVEEVRGVGESSDDVLKGI